MTEEQLKEFLSKQIEVNNNFKKSLEELVEVLKEQDKRIKELESKLE